MKQFQKLTGYGTLAGLALWLAQMAGRGRGATMPAWMTRQGGGAADARAGGGAADVYGYEEAAEREAELRALHQPMREWYARPENAPLRAKCGELPAFWRDLGAWPSYRDVKRRYLAHMDGVSKRGVSCHQKSAFDKCLSGAESRNFN